MTDAAILEEDSGVPPVLLKKSSVFSWPAFLQGLAAIALIYALLFGWAALRSADTAQNHQERLKSKTVLIEWPAERRDTLESSSADPSTALPLAPFEGMTEEGEYGTLPKIREKDGLKPFHAYKRPFEGNIGTPRVALAFSAIGHSKALTDDFFRGFPPEVTVILSPYVRNGQETGKLAREFGHEFWLELPLERQDSLTTDSGPQVLLRNVSLEQNQGRMSWLLSQMQGYAGVVAPPRHVFSADPTDIKQALEQIMGRGLAFVDADSLGSAEIGVMAVEKKVPYSSADLFIPYDTPVREIAVMLNQLEVTALQNGKAFAVIEASPATLKIAQAWLKSLPEKGVQSAPLSAVIE